MSEEINPSSTKLNETYGALPFPIVIQDISQLNKGMGEIEEILGKDIPSVLNQQPYLFDPIATNIQTVYANALALRACHMNNLDEFIEFFTDSFRRQAKPLIAQLLNALKHRDNYYSGICKITLLDATALDAMVFSSIHKDGDKLYAVMLIFDTSWFALFTHNQQQLSLNMLHAEKLETIGTLIAGITNDFNNVLSPIIGYTDMALKETPERSLLHKNLQRIMRSAERAKYLVTNMQTFSHKVEPQLKPTNLRDVLIEASQLVQSQLPDSITLKLNLSQEAVRVNADENQIHHLLINLCENAKWAIQHSLNRDTGEIGINCSTVRLNEELLGINSNSLTASHFLIEVTDNGCGIVDDIREKIFDPFFTTKNDGESTGIGLSIVHAIAISHNAEMLVECDAGVTRFKLYLPCLDSTESLNDSSDERVPHIVCIDDEQDILDLLSAMLDSEGYELKMFDDPVEGLDYILTGQKSIDLIILDRQMPRMRGDRVAEQVKKNHPNIPIILLSGNANMILAEEDKPLGQIKLFNKLLMKPVLRSELIEAIEGTLTEVQTD